MTEDFGSGVSRTLSALARQFSTVVWQQGKPPLDSEFNLMSQVTWENLSQLIRSQAHSGFFTDPLRPQDDFVFNKDWANFFRIGQSVSGELDPTVFANVNGWIVPVTGTRLNDTANKIALNPPPTSGERIDFVFLEVWRTLIAPNPSTLNKPTATELWTYGNVEYGGTNITDDLEDPAIGFETTERVQLQYRLRVHGISAGAGTVTTDLYTFPDGLDDPNVLGQGAASSPVGGYTFTNMKDALGDPSLWRAGNGDAASRTDLGTVDGYAYAIPVCAIFRRNSTPFVAVDFAGNPNENGGANRTPSSASLPDPRDGAVDLSSVTLTSFLDAATTGVVNATGLVGSGLDDPDLFLPGPTQYLVIGEGINQEIVGITAVDGPGGNFTISTRGNGYTMAKRHPAGTSVKFYNSRPDGLYSDEIAAQDVLDLRRSVSLGEWDYQQLLFNALGSLAKNELRSAFKKAGTGAENAGPVTTEVSYMNGGGGAIPNHMAQVDAPDGIRTVWSDAAAIQGDLTNIIDDQALLAGNFTSTTWDVTVASSWTVSPSFVPNGFLNNTGGAGSGFRNGSSFFLHIGGNSGSEGARGGFFTANNKTVRFISPQEFWKSDSESSQQHPFRIRFLEEQSMRPAAIGESPLQHPGPMYPLESENFEKPFIVLGGNLNTALNVVGLPASAGGIGNNLYNNTGSGGTFEINVGFDFDLAGNFYPTGNVESLDPASVTFPLLRSQRTLFDMLTKGGVDRTGASSEVYIVVYGDPASENNNGAFQVIGAGTVGYTSSSASQSTNIVVRPLNQDFTQFDNNPANNIEIQFRSQYMNAEDGDGRVSGNAAAVLVLTDVEAVSGGSNNPWNAANVGAADAILQPLQQKFIIDSTIQWHPSHAAFARIPDDLIRFSMKAGGGNYLRDQLSDVDPTFQNDTGNPSDERFYDFSQLQTWNRLPSLGQDAPNAPDYGGNLVGSSEQDREAELFIDKGSKTIVFRPYMDRSLLFQTQQTGAIPSLIGDLTYVTLDPKDPLNLFTANKTLAFFLAPEYMPRFGRQDIPYHQNIAGSLFLPGINHIFNDQADPTQTVFNIIGGQDNTTGGNQVSSLLITTEPVGGATYAQSSTLGVSPTPCYIGRNFASNDIISSDLGVGMKGIELPPYLGIARLYGVYEYNDFINNAGTNPGTGESGFSPDRVTPVANLTNLLRTNATKQTLFIRQDGAEDFTTEKGDHTYIVPESAIDISLIPTFNDGDIFEDFTYVVECVVFGFAKNFIDGNNIVLCRNHNGAGTLRPDNTDFEITGVKMVLPSAADNKNPIYGAINRTVYQGDPYMTRNGATIQNADYANRYAQILNTDAYYLNFPIQQFDASGNMFVERPNPRSFEVLASADFYTTVGTGKIGGQMYSGTVLDVGYTDTAAGAVNRIPAIQTEPEWRVLQRAFTEGQKDNPEKAGLVIHLLDAPKINNVTDQLEVKITKVNGDEVDYFGNTVVAPFSNTFIGVNTIDLAHDLTDLINNGNKATGTIEIVSPIVLLDGDTITINGEPFTARAVPAVPTDFLLAGSAVATAANLATVVTSHFTGLVNRPNLLASSGGTNIVTVTTVKGGVFGNSITLATSNPGAVTLSGATLSGGSDSEVADTVKAVWAYDRVCLQAVPSGAVGGQIRVTLSRIPTVAPPAGTPIPVTDCAQIEDKKGNLLYSAPFKVSAVTSAFLVGGEDKLVNGGNGDSPINIVGLTERLPLGILVSDSDFLFEDPLSDSGSFMKITSGSIRPVFEDLPLTTGGDEYTRFLGAAGELLAASDGSILQYEPENPPEGLTGADSFRLYRGGGASFMLSGRHPGGPLNWLIDSLSPASKPVLKGAVLACKAVLVRNFKEDAFAISNTRSTGDEIQMLVMTYAIYGDGDTAKNGVPLEGQVSPTGYGEGFAAVDRYRLPARPMSRGRIRETPDPSQEPAPFFKSDS